MGCCKTSKSDKKMTLIILDLDNTLYYNPKGDFSPDIAADKIIAPREVYQELNNHIAFHSLDDFFLY